MTWLRAVERLSRSGPSEVADAHLHLRELVGVARALGPLVREPHDCGGPACPFGEHDAAGPLCSLVPRLAALDVAALPAQPADGTSLAVAFVAAVADAAETVRWCRLTAHPGGVCWFVSSHGGDCGDVLKLSHRLS